MQRDALTALEGVLADLLLPQRIRLDESSLHQFLKLQDTFQYNSAENIHIAFAEMLTRSHQLHLASNCGCNTKSNLFAGARRKEKDVSVARSGLFPS